jgi:hypothetical protein
MKTVDELVSEWSEEERERLRELIEECREREKKLIENSKHSAENLSRLTDSLTAIFTNAYEIREKVNKIGDDFLGIYLKFYKKKMPSA